MRNNAAIIFLVLAAFSSYVPRGGGLRSYFYYYYDEIATASCTALSASYNIMGHVTAVRRACGTGPNCTAVCKNANKVPYFGGKFDSFK